MRLEMENISTILREHGLGAYIPVFKKQNISCDILHLLTDDDLRSMGVTSLGDFKRFSNMIGLKNGRISPRTPRSSRGPPDLATTLTRANSSNSLQDILIEEGLVPVLDHTSERFFTRLLKMFIGIAFFFVSIATTALTMVWCHERVPDAVKHPPLPDLGKCQ